MLATIAEEDAKAAVTAAVLAATAAVLAATEATEGGMLLATAATGLACMRVTVTRNRIMPAIEPYSMGGMVNGSPYNAYSLPVTQSQSFYSGPNGNRTATIRVQVPADAQIWFGDSLTQQQGVDRIFESPPLEGNRDYSYTIKARWTKDGKPEERTRQVTVQPGQPVTVNFMDQQGQPQEPRNNIPPPKPAEKQEKKSGQQDN